MKIAICSDFHLGFAEGLEREEECFEQAAQALALAIENGAELIVHAGDLFDHDVPSQECWDKTFKLFSCVKAAKADAGVLVEKKGIKKEFRFSCTPIIAIHGTHEARGRDFKNALEVLESAGLLVHLHAATASFNGLVVHGLSGVPEKKALDALKLWAPKPVSGKKNMLVLHQSIKEFLPFDDDMIASISLADLPVGFDLTVNGHLHWKSEQDLKGKKFVMPGSTVLTQMKNLESGQEKGIFMWDSDSSALTFISIPNQRQFFYKKLEFDRASTADVLSAVEKEIESILENRQDGKPLVKIKLVGKLALGLKQSDLNLALLLKKFSEKVIVSIDKGFEEVSFAKKLEELRSIQKSRKSISAMGLDLLEKNLAQTKFNGAFDVHEFFSLFEAGKVNEAVERLSVVKKKEEAA